MGSGLYSLRERIKRWAERRRLAQAKRAVQRFPATRRRKASDLDAELIVSLTSYPKRFPTLALTLRSLLDQRVMADRTILWIAARDRALLPEEVLALTAHGLEIRDCADIRSYKKLIPALAAFPQAWIATADDDIYYPPEWLGGLLAGRDHDGLATVAGRMNLARFDARGYALPYASWSFDVPDRQVPDDGELLFPVGAGGILYPPACLHADVLDEAAFTALCPEGDDIWFFHMQRRMGTRQRRARRRLPLVCWPSSQDDALWLKNVNAGRNDRQIQALEACYGPLGAAPAK